MRRRMCGVVRCIVRFVARVVDAAVASQICYVRAWRDVPHFVRSWLSYASSTAPGASVCAYIRRAHAADGGGVAGDCL